MSDSQKSEQILLLEQSLARAETIIKKFTIDSAHDADIQKVAALKEKLRAMEATASLATKLQTKNEELER